MKIENDKGVRKRMEESKIKIKEFIEEKGIEDGELAIISHFSF